MAQRIVTAREQFEMSAPWRVAAVPEFPQFGHQIPDAPGKHPDDFWGSGGCGAMALAFKNMWPDLKIGADVDNKDGTLNHAWVHDGKRAHDWFGTHSDPHGPSGQWHDFTHHEDMDPAHLAEIMGHKWSPEDPWADDTVNDAAGEIEKHWLRRQYNPETGDYERYEPGVNHGHDDDDDDDDWERDFYGSKRRVMSAVTLYTKPGCPGCKGTARELDKHGIPFQSRDVTQDPEAMAHVQQLGYQGLPVVYAGDDNHWTGHRPDRVKALLQ